MRVVEKPVGYGGLGFLAAALVGALGIRFLYPEPAGVTEGRALVVLQLVIFASAFGGGLMAAAISAFSRARHLTYFPAVAASLLAMAVVSAHLVLEPVNDRYLLLQTAEQLMGGLFLLLGCFVGNRFPWASDWRLPAVAIGMAFLVVAGASNGWIPPPGTFLTDDGHYGPYFCVLINAAGLSFLLAAVLLFDQYRRSKTLLHWVFCAYALVSGLSNIAWPEFSVWGAHWCVLHSLLAGAYLLVLLYLVALHAQIERSLERSEQRFAALSSATFEGILQLENGRIADHNGAFAAMTGLSRASLRGMPLSLLLPEDVVRGLGDVGRSFVTWLRGEASSIPVEVRSRRAGTTHFVIFRDLTEQRGLEREVAEAQARLDELFRHSTDGIAYAELDGKVLHANDAFSRLTGYSKEALAAGVAAADVLRGRGAHLRRPGVPAVPNEYEREYVDRSGKRIDVVQTEFPVRDVEGRVTHVGILVKDVTESRLTTRTLRALNEELTRSNRELYRFAAVVAHDLAEPLRTISTALRLLEKREGATLRPESRRSLAFASAASDRLRALIRGLLGYSRVQTLGHSLQSVDCQQAMSHVLENIRALVEESGARIESGPLPVVRADPELVEVVLQNLVVNAIKYRRDCSPEIRVTAEACAEGWLFAVSDNGRGIASHSSERVFELFARAQDDVPGEGIGLATCKKIVESLGGRIWVESTPNVGSTFYFILAADAATSDDAVAKRSP
jgi:PAS domain S-box-containing protein